MNPDLPHRGRANRCRSVLVALISVVLLSGIASTASAESPELPLLYKGNGYRLEPGLMWGWDRDGVGKPIRYLGKISISDPAGSAVRWTFWDVRRAVGVGLARSSGCGMGGRPGECELGYPWNGAKLRVVAWRPRSGHFTRMKMTTRVPRDSARFYELVLAYRGPSTRVEDVSWKTVLETRG